ncbi:phage major capsid protein, partial [Bifidobacterium bifidum]
MADNFSSQILRGDLGGALIPDEISQEIIQTLPQSSVLLTRARRVPMSSKKKTQPVLASLPEAYWVSEGGLKQTSKTGWEDVQITAEELAVIVPIPDSVVDDAKINLWDTVKPLIAEAMGKKIDQAGIFGVDKPSTWGNDILAGATAAGTNVASGTGVDLADDIAMIGQKLSEKGFAVNGFASQPGLNWQLARLRDANGQPIYTPSVAAGNPA